MIKFSITPEPREDSAESTEWVLGADNDYYRITCFWDADQGKSPVYYIETAEVDATESEPALDSVQTLRIFDTETELDESYRDSYEDALAALSSHLDAS